MKSSISLQNGMKLPSFYIDTKGKTFEEDEKLPSLPIPSLSHTLNRYLDSVRPFLSSNELKKTKYIVNNFKNGIGQELNFKLHERAKYQKNWLEKWWEDIAYLQFRLPTAPYVNVCGPAPFSYDIWKPKDGSQIPRAAQYLWYSLQFWKLLKQQNLRVDKDSRGKSFSMNQFYRMFNSCKIPGKSIDKLKFHFKTESEGFSPIHLTILCKGRFFTVQVIDEENNPYSIPELQFQLQYVRDFCDKLPWGDNIGALTGLDRTRWASLRKHLKHFSSKNLDNLNIIETSLMNFVLDDQNAYDHNQLSIEALCGDCRNRFFDKGMSAIILKNGMICLNNDHAPFDAMVFITSANFIQMGLKLNNFSWKGSFNIRSDLPIPKELKFDLDETITKNISSAILEFRKNADSIDVVCMSFDDFGKKFIRKFNLHPATIVQISLQLAYFRLYNKPGQTYETATTRGFYHGRTETLRPCTNEVLKFCQNFSKNNNELAMNKQLLYNAMEKHNQLRIEAQQNQGCDRHLFGLKLIAQENNIPIPEIFIDPAYVKSGGNGNFILSTSFVGFSEIHGGVAPMCKDGYGCFFSIPNDRIFFFISSWKSDEATNCNQFMNMIFNALRDIMKLVENTDPVSHL